MTFGVFLNSKGYLTFISFFFLEDILVVCHIFWVYGKGFFLLSCERTSRGFYVNVCIFESKCTCVCVQLRRDGRRGCWVSSTGIYPTSPRPPTGPSYRLTLPTVSRPLPRPLRRLPDQSVSLYSPVRPATVGWFLTGHTYSPCPGSSPSELSPWSCVLLWPFTTLFMYTTLVDPRCQDPVLS